jgi:uncharacterized protein
MHLTNDFYKIHAPVSCTLPAQIRPFSLAEQGACIEGTMSFEQMPRLRENLKGQHGEVQVVLRFNRGASGLYMVVGEVRARIELQCQRCLEPMTKRIAQHIELALVRSEAEAHRLQAAYEVLELAGDAIGTKDLVEDELLLAIPFVPLHEASDACDATMLKKLNDDADMTMKGAARQSPQNPFAVLKNLKGLKKT